MSTRENETKRELTFDQWIECIKRRLRSLGFDEEDIDSCDFQEYKEWYYDRNYDAREAVFEDLIYS